MKLDTSETVHGLVATAIMLVALYGYVANIVKLVGSDFDPMTGLVILRIIGVVIGTLGAILGFF
jgi:uncharacterized oligopeptide transporter (OPT) family protein